jgi:hypothetical protein
MAIRNQSTSSFFGDQASASKVAYSTSSHPTSSVDIARFGAVSRPIEKHWRWRRRVTPIMEDLIVLAHTLNRFKRGITGFAKAERLRDHERFVDKGRKQFQRSVH